MIERGGSKMNRLNRLMVAVVFFIATAVPVFAAQPLPGKYKGMTGQGQPMWLIVAEREGRMVLAQFGFTFILECESSGDTINSEWGFVNPIVPIAEDGAFQYESGDVTGWFFFSGSFDSSTEVEGEVFVETPGLLFSDGGNGETLRLLQKCIPDANDWSAKKSKSRRSLSLSSQSEPVERIEVRGGRLMIRR